MFQQQKDEQFFASLIPINNIRDRQNPLIQSIVSLSLVNRINHTSNKMFLGTKCTQYKMFTTVPYHLTTTVFIIMNSFSVIFLASAFTLASAKSTDFAPSATISENRSIFDDPTRIVNGLKATVGQFPHQVLLRRTENGQFLCSGSIISNRWIITSAHCTKGRPAIDFVAVAGTIKLSKGGVRYEINVNKPHPGFVMWKHGHNIALVRTKEPIVFNKLVQPIALPTETTLSETTATISGWGKLKQYHHRIPDHLRYLKTTIISPASCKRRLPHVPANFDEIICHLHPRGGACYGDSGETLMRYDL